MQHSRWARVLGTRALRRPRRRQQQQQKQQRHRRRREHVTPPPAAAATTAAAPGAHAAAARHTRVWALAAQNKRRDRLRRAAPQRQSRRASLALSSGHGVKWFATRRREPDSRTAQRVQQRSYASFQSLPTANRSREVQAALGLGAPGGAGGSWHQPGTWASDSKTGKTHRQTTQHTNSFMKRACRSAGAPRGACQKCSRRRRPVTRT